MVEQLYVVFCSARCVVFSLRIVVTCDSPSYRRRLICRKVPNHTSNLR